MGWQAQGRNTALSAVTAVGNPPPSYPQKRALSSGSSNKKVKCGFLPKAATTSDQPKLLPVLLTGHEHRTVSDLRLEHGLLVSPSRERQRNLAAFGGGPLE